MIKQFLEEQGFDVHDNGKELSIDLNLYDPTNKEIVKGYESVEIDYNSSIKEFLLVLMKKCYMQGYYNGSTEVAKSIEDFITFERFEKYKSYVNPFENQLK